MAKILILYSTVDGHTIKIGQRLKQRIEENGSQVTLLSIEDHRQLDLPSFDKIIIGASIRYGKHRESVSDFIASHLKLLEGRPSAFFSVNIVARKEAKNRPETNPYVRKFLKHIAWHPAHVAVFAGRLDYPSYSFFDRFMIRLIMMITKGPTDPATVIEYTDWKKVDEFAQVISTM